jgi:DNA-binding SARP family transcriptional activator/DNA-binding beta-propeller fold protein YncE
VALRARAGGYRRDLLLQPVCRTLASRLQTTGGGYDRSVEFRVLGPLEVVDQGSALSLGGSRQRVVLAYLILEANRVVPTDRLIDRIWGEEPPDAARSALFAYVSRLRKLLGPGRIQARPPGYILRAEREEIDALRFTDLIDEARRAGSDRKAAGAGLTAALDLWRGAALSDLADYDALRPAVTRLEELRLGALEDRAEAELDLGRHREAVPSLESLTGEHPLRERLWSLLILALYRSGRQGDALGAFHRARTTLVEELGIDPSPELRRLHERVLQQDPQLDLLPPPRAASDAEAPAGAAMPEPVSGTRRQRWRQPAVAAGLAAVVLLAGGYVLLGGRTHSLVPVPNSVLQIEPATGDVIAVVRVGTRPGATADGDGSVWIANFDDRTIQPISASTGEPGAAFGGFAGNPIGLAVGDGSVFVAIGFPTGRVLQVDPAAHNTIQIVIDNQPGLESMAYGEGALWVTNSQHESLFRIDAGDPASIRRLELPGAGPAGVAVSPGAVWVAERLGGAVVEIDPETLSVRRTIEVLSGEPSQIAYGAGFVWVTNTADDAVLRIDPAPNGTSTTIAGVGNGPIGIAVGDGGVWVANSLGRSIVRIEPGEGTIIGSVTLPSGVSPVGVTVAGGAVWVTLQAG